MAEGKPGKACESQGMGGQTARLCWVFSVGNEEAVKFVDTEK